MDVKASKVVAALDFLQQLALNPHEAVPLKHRSVLDEVRKSYSSNPKGAKSGKKRKPPPSKSAPKPKRQRTSKSRARRSDKEENDEDTTSIADKLEDAELIEDSAIDRGIRGDSPSHFAYFGEDEGVFIADKDALTALWRRGDPRRMDLDNYLHSVAKIFYHPIEAMDQHITLQHRSKADDADLSKSTHSDPSNVHNVNTLEPEKKVKRGRGRPKGSKNKKSKADKVDDPKTSVIGPDGMKVTESKLFRYSTVNLILSPLRKRSPIDEWNPREVALFESAMCFKGKRFYEISKMIGTKNTKQCVEFYYHWKQSSNYAVWKALGRRTNKKATSSSQRKLHKKIGQKFAEFHAKHCPDTANKKGDGHGGGDGGGGSGPQVNSIQNDLNQLNVNAAAASNGNAHSLLDGHGAMAQVAAGGHDHAVLFQQQLNSQQQAAAMGVVGYYPQYYAQNGYPMYYPQHAAYAQYQHQHHPPHHAQQQQPPVARQQQVSGGQDNGRGGGGGTGQAANGGDKAMCIDLTDTASLGNDGSGKGTAAPAVVEERPSGDAVGDGGNGEHSGHDSNTNMEAEEKQGSSSGSSSDKENVSASAQNNGLDSNGQTTVTEQQSAS